RKRVPAAQGGWNTRPCKMFFFSSPRPTKPASPYRAGGVSRLVRCESGGAGVAGRLGAERGKPKERSDKVDEAVPGAGAPGRPRKPRRPRRHGPTPIERTENAQAARADQVPVRTSPASGSSPVLASAVTSGPCTT